MSEKKTISDFEKQATRVSAVGIIGNVILTAFKLLAGILAHSGAMISDAVHSMSDVVSSFIVIAGVKISEKKEDDDHPYGHERFECVAAIVLSVVLLITGLFIARGAVTKITGGDSNDLETPGVLALVAAVSSIVTKEAMYRYTNHYAARYDSAALRASALDHRSDAFSSLGALVGIAGARMGFAVLDPAASLLICVFILKSSVDIFKDATDKMVDHSCDAKTEEDIRLCTLGQYGVVRIDLLQTRVFANKIYVDMEISVDGNLSILAGHAIAESVHDAIEAQFPKVKHIMIHVNPA